MAAPNPDDLAVSAISGQPILELVDDQTTVVSWRVELRGVAVAVDATPTVTLIKTTGSGVSLTPNIATTGEITVSVTSGNIDSAGLSLGDTAWIIITGAHTDGANVLPIRRNFAVNIVPGLQMWTFMYAELTERYGQLTKSCAFPDSQTTFFPQLRPGLRTFRRHLFERFGQRSKLLIPEQLQGLEMAYALRAVCEYQRTGREGYWHDRVAEWNEEISATWKRLEVTVASGPVAHGSVPSGTVTPLESGPYRRTANHGSASFGGGM
jgi:hypothetical protein